MGIVESDLENLARSLLARLSYDYGDAEDIDPDVAELFRRGERLLSVSAPMTADEVHMNDAEKLQHALAALRDLVADVCALSGPFGFYVPASVYYAEAILRGSNDPIHDGRRALAEMQKGRGEREAD